MSKCTTCRKADALDTRIERITRWIFYRMFPKQIIDLGAEKFTQGFGDGYKKGHEHGITEFKPDMSRMWPLQKENAPIRTSNKAKKNGKSRK